MRILRPPFVALPEDLGQFLGNLQLSLDCSVFMTQLQFFLQKSLNFASKICFRFDLLSYQLGSFFDTSLLIVSHIIPA
jgi:hypothetical protein